MFTSRPSGLRILLDEPFALAHAAIRAREVNPSFMSVFCPCVSAVRSER